MQTVQEILEDWRACGPDGVVLRAVHLPRVMDRIVSAIDESLAAPALRRHAYKMLSPTSDLSSVEGGLPPLVRQLQVDGSRRFAASSPSSAVAAGRGGAVIHFVCFWKAVGEVRRRLRHPEEVDEEPIAEEVVAFRDALLRDARDNVLTRASFGARVADAKGLSEDPSAWVSLEATAAALAAEPEPTAAKEGRLMLEQISVLLLMWLPEVLENYLHGGRWAEIRSVRDVLGCSLREACEHLGKSGWDVEAALRSFYSRGPPLVATAAGLSSGAWGSQSAKLRSSELECPICCKEFDHGTEPFATRCCFQVLCVHCVDSLTDDEGMLTCPFCRRLEPRAPRRDGVGDLALAAALGDEAAGDAFINSVRQAAEKYAQDLRGLLAFALDREATAGRVDHRVDLRLHAVFPLDP